MSFGDTPHHQSGAFCLQLWASQFLFLSESQHYVVAFWFSRTQTQSSLCYSFQHGIYSFIVYPIAWNNPTCLVGFSIASCLYSCLYIYWAGKIRHMLMYGYLPQSFNIWRSTMLTMIFVFLMLTLRPLASKLVSYLINFILSSSSVSAMITRSSA